MKNIWKKSQAAQKMNNDGSLGLGNTPQVKTYGVFVQLDSK